MKKLPIYATNAVTAFVVLLSAIKALHYNGTEEASYAGKNRKTVWRAIAVSLVLAISLSVSSCATWEELKSDLEKKWEFIIRDLDDSVKMFQEDLDKALAETQGNIDRLSEEWNKFKRNLEEPIKMIQEDLNKAVEEAKHNLDQLAKELERVANDLAKSAELMLLAAEKGNPDAQYNLAVLLALGIGVPKSVVDAYMWLEVAANNGLGQDVQKTLSAIAKELSNDEVNKAIEKAKTCIASNFQNCD